MARHLGMADAHARHLRGAGWCGRHSFARQGAAQPRRDTRPQGGCHWHDRWHDACGSAVVPLESARRRAERTHRGAGMARHGGGQHQQRVACLRLLSGHPRLQHGVSRLRAALALSGQLAGGAVPLRELHCGHMGRGTRCRRRAGYRGASPQADRPPDGATLRARQADTRHGEVARNEQGARARGGGACGAAPHGTPARAHRRAEHALRLIHVRGDRGRRRALGERLPRDAVLLRGL